jgi:type I restriction enzyme, S subunit
MKRGWQTKKLGDVCRFIDYRGKTPEKTTSGLRLVTAKNVKMGYLQETPREFVAPKSYDGWMTRGIPKMGDVLFTTEAPLANVAQLDTEEKVVFAQRIIVLQPSENNLDRTFLKYLLLSDLAQHRIHEKGTGATVKGIKASLLKSVPIEFPPLPEQQRIVGVLDEAFEGIATAKANAEKNLHNARALFESHLQSVFIQRGEGWQEGLVGSICDVKHGFAFDGTEFSSDVLEGKPLVITPGNFTDDSKLLFNEKNTKRFSGIPPAGFLFNVGDLVVVMTDLSSKMKILGKPAFVETDDVLHNQRIGRVVFLNNRVEKRFLYYFMMSEGFLKNIKESATGTMVKHTAPKRILSNVIPFPRDRKVQRTIVAKLDDLRAETQRLASLYQQKLAALEALKKSLLDQAFSGEL